MSLRKPLTINWKGKVYSLVVTMEVIDRIENHISLITMVRRCAAGDVRMSHAAKLISLVLKEAGCDASQEEVYGDLFGGSEVSPAELRTLLNGIFSVIFPEQKKKSESETGEKKNTKSPTKTNSRGNRSTK